MKEKNVWIFFRYLQSVWIVQVVLFWQWCLSVVQVRWCSVIIFSMCISDYVILVSRYSGSCCFQVFVCRGQCWYFYYNIGSVNRIIEMLFSFQIIGCYRLRLFLWCVVFMILISVLVIVLVSRIIDYISICVLGCYCVVVLFVIELFICKGLLV